MNESERYRQMELDPKYGDGDLHRPANVDHQMEAAKAQALFYEQQRRQWEEQRIELEQVNQKKALFLAGLNEVGLSIHNAQRRIEQEMGSIDREYHELEHVRECLQQHLRVLSALQPETWSTEGLNERLREALPKLDRAENDLNEAYFMGKKMHHTTIFQSKPGEVEKKGMDGKLIASELARGFFFHLPLFLLLLVCWGVWYLVNHA
ncbi:MAG: hypothetical protein R3Y56_06835 [Akkermansia sp.]